MKFEPLAKSLIATALAIGFTCAQAASQVPVAAENGMVVTAQHLATRIGVDVLKDGGNAVDAAVAVGYALAVVYPAAGKTVMVVGTPGGSRIITATLLTMLNVIDYGMNIQEAVDAPRFHQQWLPEETNLEAFAVSPDTQKILESRGQKFTGPQDLNHVAAILVGAPSLGGKPVGNNRFYGANDPRRGSGLSLGY